MDSSSANNIADFYVDRCVFITGATGFMGKVLVEKLLRSCPDIRKLYLLVRPKKGQSPRKRVDDLLDCKLFDQIRKDVPGLKDKVEPVTGDILEPCLGISDEDRERLAADVSIVFHSAATVKFDEALKLSIQMNVLGVREVLSLAKQMPKLVALVHLSTAYANCDKTVVQEQIYPPPIHPKKVIDAIEWMDDNAICLLTPHLIKPRPNTYTFTKALAEQLLLEERDNLPIAIVRPSIVGASWQEPLPGWVDNFNGPTGIFIAIGTGLLRSMLSDFKAVADIIPVDMATNLMIATAWHIATEKPTNVQVYHCTSGNSNPVTWGEFEKTSYKYLMKNPLDNIVRLPNPKSTSNTVWHRLNLWFDHYLPAWSLDVYLKIIGKKPMFMRLQERIQKSVVSLDYFTSNHWEFENQNMMRLAGLLSPADKKTFNFDVMRIRWEKYMENFCLGVKLYVLKEDLANMPAARKRVRRMQLRHRLWNIALFLLTWYFLVSRFSILGRLSHSIRHRLVTIVKTVVSIGK